MAAARHLGDDVAVVLAAGDLPVPAPAYTNVPALLGLGPRTAALGAKAAAAPTAAGQAYPLNTSAALLFCHSGSRRILRIPGDKQRLMSNAML
jgi:hypothetical protein